tara:strand:- start:145 stop:888 length:744 start_codon:yes stop_codon:yes gene_type:complete
MSIKSLLQFILLLLIVIILGGIYFLYFYSSPVKKSLLDEKNLEEFNKILENKDTSSDQEILGDNKNKEDYENIDTNSENTKQNITEFQKNKDNQTINKQIEKDINVTESLMKNIEYVTTNKNDDVFKILAKNGKTNIENSNVLDLTQVDGIISSKERTDIFITSDFANYNYTNQNSKFYRNVIIKYDNKIMTCDNFDLFSNDNIAIAYGNVIIEDNNSYMKAENVILNIITKDVNINSTNKIKIITN